MRRLIADLHGSIKNDPEGLEALCTTYELGMRSEAAIFKATDLTQIARFGDKAEHFFIRVDRMKLRQWLLRDIKVTWSKTFTRFKQNEEGVMAFFEDGTFAKGDMLVGAGGIGSRSAWRVLSTNEADPPQLEANFSKVKMSIQSTCQCVSSSGN